MLVVSSSKQRLVAADARGLHALLALLGHEGDSLALLKGLEAVLLLRESVMGSDGDEGRSSVLSDALCVMQQYNMAQHTQTSQILPQWRGSGRRGQRSRSRG